MPAARILGALLPVLLLLFIAGAGTWWALRREERDPSSFTRQDDLAWWGLLPAEEQEEHDTAVLDLAEQAVLDAEYEAREAVRLAVDKQVQAAIAEAVKRSALFRRP